MSPLPTHMRDRWQNRAEPETGFGTIYWHVLLSRYEEARAAGSEAQAILSQFPGFHMTPTEWFHMTTLLVGPADNVNPTQLSSAVAQATKALEHVEPVEATISRVIYHPEAILLALDPVESLRPIRCAAQEASSELLDKPLLSSAGEWVPHMTVAYSIPSQSPEPILAALGHRVPTRQVLIRAMTLVIQWGPERLWDWELVGEIPLRARRGYYREPGP